MSDFPAIAAYGASVGLDPESALTGWSPMPDGERDKWRAVAVAARSVPDEPSQTAMRLHAGENWPKVADTWHRGDSSWLRLDDLGRPVTTLRRVGWLDQKGRVWIEVPPQAGFDGGSLTPLLIDARD